MRLTLRTLLAYLDDTLDPIQTKHIGQKVAESDSAQELIARIKQVARRRSLTTPEAQAGDKSAAADANLIADYLDNTLPPEQVAQIEKICLESDVHLAEVAACHQILTLVLGEPASVPPSARQRMYKLVKGPEAVHKRKPPVFQSASDREPAVDDRDETDEALLLGLPAYRPKSWRSRLIPAAVLLLLAGGLIAVLYQAIIGRERGETPVVADRARPRPELVAQPAPPAVRWDTVAEKELGPVLGPALHRGSWELTMVGNRVELPDAPAPVEVQPIPVAPPVPKPETKPVEPLKVSPVPPPNAAQVEVGQHVGRSLLVRKAGETDWRWLRHQSRVLSGQLLVSLPGFRSEIQLDRKVRLELIGNLPEISNNPVFESAVVIHENPNLDLDLTLERGRIVISSMKPDAPMSLRVRFHDQAWDIKLLEPDTVVGLELTGRIDRTSKERWPTRAKLSLAVVSGPIELKRSDKVEHFTEGRMLPWDNLLSSSNMLTPVFPLPKPPVWMARGPKHSEEVRLALANLERRFAEKLDQRVKADDELRWMRLAFSEMQADNRRLDRRLAVFCMGAVDEMDRVLAALEEAEKPEARDAAWLTLMHWLGRKPDQDQQLRPFLRERGFADEDAVTFVRLLRGADEGTPANYQFLLGCLASPRLPVRELANFNLVQLLQPAQRVPFDPAGPEEQRDKAIQTLKARLPKPAEDK